MSISQKEVPSRDSLAFADESTTESKFSGDLMKQVEDFFSRLKSENQFFNYLEAGRITADHVAALLVNTHYLIRHTPPHLQAALRASREPGYRFPELAEYFAHHADEEVGHHHWAEEDLGRLERRSRLDEGDAVIAPKMKELVAYIHSLIAGDVALYLPYILYAEYISVVAVPETVAKLRDRCGIPSAALPVFTNHATLDQGHAGEDGVSIDAVVARAPEYKESFRHVITTASQIYFEFLESLVSAPANAVARRAPVQLDWREVSGDDAALADYGEIGARLWGAKYPPAYLRQGQVHAAFLDGQMVGGFAVIENGPLRTLQFLTESMRRASPLMQRTPDSDFCEIAGFWFKSGVEVLRGRTDLLWCQFRAVARTLRQPYLIYGYNFARRGLAKIYAPFGPTVLYRGPIEEGRAPVANVQLHVSIEAILTSSMEAAIPKVVLKNRRDANHELRHPDENVDQRPFADQPVLNSSSAPC